jgi:hypothetical protein
MGRLKGHVYESKMVKLTKPHFFKKGQKKAERVAIPIKMLVRIDPSDARYKMIEGRLRRDPETLPLHRRDPEAMYRWKAAEKGASKPAKEGKKRKAA